MTRIAVISAGMGNPSATRLLADRLADTVVAQLTVAGAAANAGDEGQGESTAVDVIELRELAHPLADNLLTGFPSGLLAAACDTVEAADALIVVTPVFAASYSGLFKMFFDVLEPELLRGKPVLLAATAGSARHSLVLEHALRPLFVYLGAVTAPTAVFAAAEDWGGNSEPGAALNERIDRAATDLVGLLTPSATRRARPPRAQQRWGAAVGFERPAEFAELLRRARA